MTQLWVIGIIVTLILLTGMTYLGYLMGYSRGRLAQIDRLTGTMSKADAMKMTVALEKLCDFTETVLPAASRIPKAVHH